MLLTSKLRIIILLPAVLLATVDCRARHLRFAEKEDIQSHPHFPAKFAYVTWTQEGGYDIQSFVRDDRDSSDPSDINWVAKGKYQNLVNQTGWGTLEIQTNPTWSDEMQMYAAGIAEGYLTSDLILYFWQNVFENFFDQRPAFQKFWHKYADKNEKWVKKMISENKETSSYWHHVDLLHQQIAGVNYGFQNANNGSSLNGVSNVDAFLINFYADLGDLENAFKTNLGKNKYIDWDNDGHCIVFIKLIEDRDVYASHVTWWNYEFMLRIIKKYNFPLKTTSAQDAATVPGTSISMSSYPGMVWSMDDFYTTSSGLFISETTAINYNEKLWSTLSPRNSLYTVIRVMVANRLAEDAEQWTKLISSFNSGTNNNQWTVFNFGLFQPKKALRSGMLWVVEQMPGLMVAKDVTNVLNQTGYWASYNIPYSEEAYQLSHTDKMHAEFGDYFSYNHSARAKIFARDHSKVHDIDSMMGVMRYNDYKNDPLSKCNCTPPYSAASAISSRCELNPPDGKYPIQFLGHRNRGAIDMKLTNLDMFPLQQFIAIGGPTYDPLPPFQWSKSPLKNVSHFGMPDKFQFDPILHEWHWV